MAKDFFNILESRDRQANRRTHFRKWDRHYDSSIQDAVLRACKSGTGKNVWIVKVKGSKNKKYVLVHGGITAPKGAVYKLIPKYHHRKGRPTGKRLKYTDQTGRPYYVTKRHPTKAYGRSEIHEIGTSRKGDQDCDTFKYDYAYRKGSDRRRKDTLKHWSTMSDETNERLRKLKHYKK